MKVHSILVLNDGETWETMDGQSLCIVTDEEYQSLLLGKIRPKDLTPVLELTINDMTPFNDVA
jgi:hypothetical protein